MMVSIARPMPAAPFTPRELFARFDRGEIERDELHALLALCARELIDEMEEDYQNPAAALLETLLARRAIRRLLRHYDRNLIREVFVAVSNLVDFPPARYLWNASHPDVPLHCFLRMRRAPMFRIKSLRTIAHQRYELVCSFSTAEQSRRVTQSFVLTRDSDWRLQITK